MPHTISVTELVWTLASVPGLWYATRLLRKAVGDLSYLKSRKLNHLREYSAMVTVYTYFLFTFVEFGFVVAGVLAMITPPANRLNPITPLQIIVTTVFLLINFVMSTGCFIIERRRNILLEKIAQGKEHEIIKESE